MISLLQYMTCIKTYIWSSEGLNFTALLFFYEDSFLRNNNCMFKCLEEFLSRYVWKMQCWQKDILPNYFQHWNVDKKKWFVWSYFKSISDVWPAQDIELCSIHNELYWPESSGIGVLHTFYAQRCALFIGNVANFDQKIWIGNIAHFSKNSKKCFA